MVLISYRDSNINTQLHVSYTRQHITTHTKTRVNDKIYTTKLVPDNNLLKTLIPFNI